ncbi:MAG: sulfurtransferase TusA family protein [Actinomycetota bacterium]|nr:sulfurtransferase TusA family protein [Actinomycetota bacterium]
MTDAPPQADLELDARGLLCPMPIIKTAAAVRGLAPGQVLRLTTTDRGSLADVPAWTQTTGNELVAQHREGETFVFLIRKGKEA